MRLRRRDELEAREAVDIARMAKSGAGSIVVVGAVLASLAVVVAVSIGLEREWDLSLAGANTLSPQSLAVLGGLTETVHLYPLYSKQSEVERDAYWRKLRSYRRATDLLEVEFVDPQRQPETLRRIGVDTRSQEVREGATVVVRGDRRLSFRGTAEEEITNAILEVGRTGRRVVGYVRGYGEHDPRSSSGGGYRQAVEALQQEYYEVRDVDLVDGVPRDVAVLIVAGPTLPIPAADLRTLDGWLSEGGRLLAMLEPGESPALNEVLQHWGLRGTGDVVVDPRNNVNDSEQFLKVTDYSGHEAVTDFGPALPTAFPVAGRVVDFETGEGRLFHEPLLSSSTLSSLVDADGTREAGPFALAAASWRRDESSDTETRVILVGDSDWASNAYLAAQANRNLFLNAVAWLARESELITVRRNQLGGQIIELDANERGLIRLVLLAMPAIVVLAGVIVAIRRRGR